MYIPVFDILTRRCGVMTSKDWYESIICENDRSVAAVIIVLYTLGSTLVALAMSCP